MVSAVCYEFKLSFWFTIKFIQEVCCKTCQLNTINNQPLLLRAVPNTTIRVTSMTLQEEVLTFSEITVAVIFCAELSPLLILVSKRIRLDFTALH